MLHNRNICDSWLHPQDCVFLSWPQVPACCSQLISKDSQDDEIQASLPPPPPLFLHLWKSLVIWCRWFTASFMERLWENLWGLLVSDCLKEMWAVGSQLCPTGLVWEDCAWNWQICVRVSSYPYLEKDPAGEKYFQTAESAGLGGWRIFRAPVHSLPLGKGSRFLPW